MFGFGNMLKDYLDYYKISQLLSRAYNQTNRI